MKNIVLETVKIKVHNFTVTSTAEVIVTDPDEKNAILNRCSDIEFIFRRIVKELKLPAAVMAFEGQKVEHQPGKARAKINTKSATAIVEFFVEAEDQDLIDSVKQRYEERKHFEFENMRNSAEIANKYDPDELDENQLNELISQFNEITKKSCIIKKYTDISKIAELKLRSEDTDEIIFDDAVKIRLKQVINHLNFNYKQEEFDSYVRGFKDDAVELKIFDEQHAEQTAFIPATFSNKNFKALFIAHYLSAKPFHTKFHDPESLKLSKNPKKKIEPSTISGLMDDVEAEKIYKAFLFCEQGQEFLEFDEKN